MKAPLDRFNAHRVVFWWTDCSQILLSLGDEGAGSVHSKFEPLVVLQNMNMVLNRTFVTSFGADIPVKILKRLGVLGARVQAGLATSRMVGDFERLLEDCGNASLPPPDAKPRDWKEFWKWHSQAIQNEPGRPEIGDLYIHQMILTLYEHFTGKKRSLAAGTSMEFVRAFLTKGREAAKRDYQLFGHPSIFVKMQIGSIWKSHSTSALLKRWGRSIADDKRASNKPLSERPASLRTNNAEVQLAFHSEIHF